MWHFKHNNPSQLLPDTTKLFINLILAMLIILSKHFLKHSTNRYVWPSWFYTWKLKGRPNMFVLREANMQGVLCFLFKFDVLYLTCQFEIAKEVALDTEESIHEQSYQVVIFKVYFHSASSPPCNYMPQNMDAVIRVNYVMKQIKPQTGILEIHTGHLMLNID